MAHIRFLKQNKLRGFGRSRICFPLRFKNRWRVNVQRNTGKASSWQNQSKEDPFAYTMGKVLRERACWSQGLGSQRKLRGAGKLERFLRYVGVSPQIKKQKHYELDYIIAFENVPWQNPDCSGLCQVA